MSYGTDPLVDADVVFTSKAHAEFSDTCEHILTDELRRIGVEPPEEVAK
jgi:hypothetical protein